MAGRPRLHQLRKDIDLASEGGDGFEYVLDLIADGWSYRRIGERFGVSAKMIYDYVRGWPKWRERIGEARAVAADTRVERGGKLLEDLSKNPFVLLSPADVQLVNSQVNYEKWMAECDDPERFGSRRSGQVNVNVTVGQLHVDALRQRRVEVLEGAPVVEVVPEVEPAGSISPPAQSEEDEVLEALR